FVPLAIQQAVRELGVAVPDAVVGARALELAPRQYHFDVMARVEELNREALMRATQRRGASTIAQLVAPIAVTVSLVTFAIVGTLKVWSSPSGLDGVPYLAVAGVIALASIALGAKQGRVVHLGPVLPRTRR